MKAFKRPSVKAPAITTSIGGFGIFNQLFLVFQGKTIAQIPDVVTSMTLDQLFMAFGPLLFYLWCLFFDEEGHFKNFK